MSNNPQISECFNHFAIKNYLLTVDYLIVFFSEQEKQRRWQEVRTRQRRSKLEAEAQARRAPAHLEQSMLKSGFSMSDIKGDLFVLLIVQT